MGNLHTVAAAAVTITTTTETVIATVGPFNVNVPAAIGQGVMLDGSINLLVGTGATAAVIRVRSGSLTGALIGVAHTVTVTAGTTVELPIAELDAASLVVAGDTYVVTVQMTGASGNSTVNKVIFAAEDAVSFE